MSDARIIIQNERGLHARAATKFVKMAGQFEANITVAKGGQEVSGISIMGLMMLAAGPGNEILIRASGPDGERALASLCQLIENRFDEEA